MTTEQQIQERAREAADKIAVEPGECKCDPLPVIIDALTTQHAATEAAHREEVERLTKELKRSNAQNFALTADLHDLKSRFCDHHATPGAVSPGCPECARAEAAQLREVLRKVTEVSKTFSDRRLLFDIARADYNVEATEENSHLVSEASCNLADAETQLESALALAAPLLKEGKEA